MGVDWGSRLIKIISFILLIFLSGGSIGESLGEVNVGSGAFPSVKGIENGLIRGESTRADVQKLLGIPTGGGGAMLPGFGDHSETVEAYNLWYYEDLKTKDFKSEDGVMVMDMKQQILVIFFKGDRFYGYFWTSNGTDR